MEEVDVKFLLARVDELRKKKGINKTKLENESGVGKNFHYNLSRPNAKPSKKNLELLAKYFGVSVGYLTGEDTEEQYAEKSLGLMVEWLIDNGYEVEVDENGAYTVGKDGSTRYYANCDIVRESLAIQQIACEGYELAMLDWERRQFGDALTEEEEYIISLFRNTTAEGRAKMYQSLLNINDDIEKNNQKKNANAAG